MTDETTANENHDSLIVDDETPEQAIERLTAEIELWKDTALRAKADAENTKRRVERELNDGKAYAITKFAKDLFAVADNLSRALQAAPQEDADPALKNFALGIEMTEKELTAAFERNGVKRIHPLPGDKFDPHAHQAMAEQPSTEVPPGTVVQVYQSGYELFGRVLRPAMVVVSPKAAGDVSASQANEGASAYAKAAGNSGQ